MIIIVVSISAGALHANQMVNTDKHGVALEGYDAVSYADNKPLKGVSEFSHSYKGVVYKFATMKNKDRFTESPDKYIPAYGGWCAWAMLDGKKVDIDPETYKRVNGVTYLFYNGFWGDTLEKWNALAEDESESALIEKADDNWKKLAMP